MNQLDNPPFLVNKDYLLQKFPGKGGWTYALIPEIPMEKRFPFGWMKVSGSIDGLELKQYKLMPFGNGQLFLPVKAAIRKKIRKEAGDWVKIQLYADENPPGIPNDILDCLRDVPNALRQFNKLKEWEQKSYINWILEAKKETTKAERIVKLIERLEDK